MTAVASMPHTVTNGAEEHGAPVCQLLAVRVRTDVRVRRVAATLAEAGYIVRIIDFESDRTLTATESLNNHITVKHVMMPSLFVSARFKPWFLAKMLRMFVLAIRQLLKTPADVYHASDLKTLLPSYVVSRLRRKPLVFESYELPLVEPQVLRWRRLRSFAVTALRSLIRRCAAVIVVSPPIVREMQMLYGGPTPILLRNVPTYQPPIISNRLRERLHLPPTVRIALYQGNLRGNHSLQMLARTARLLPSDIALVLMGDGLSMDAFEALIAAEGVGERMRLVPAVPYAELLQWTASADLGLILLSPDYSLNIRYCLPNKLFEYLMAGLPVLSSSLPVVAEMLARYDAGQVCPSLTPEEIARSITTMLADGAGMARWHANALAAARELNWEVEQTTLLNLYEELLQRQLGQNKSGMAR